jgi:hypothetical protein
MVSNIFKNSRRYSHIKVHHRYQPVAPTLAAIFATSFASVVDNGGKFATSVNDTGGNLPLVSATLVANNGNNIRLLRP